MAGRSRAPQEKDLCCYVAETKDGAIKEEVVQLISKCIQDKIFSVSPDFLCVLRDDNMRECSFDAVDWDTLRTVEKNFREINAVLDEHKSDPIAVLSAVYESIQAQSLEDAYRDRKILFFGNFIADLKEPDVENLAKTFKEENVSITIVVPNKMNQTDIQKSNIKILEKTFGKTDNATILTLQEAEVRLSNLATKKTVKPTPWSYDLEIGPNLQIPVGYYVCTRKNKSTETKKALIKEVQKLSGAHKEPNELVPVPRADGNSADSDDEGPSSGQIVELTKNIVQKETFWAQTDGTIVEEEDLVEGYYYGDKLVPFDDIQHENQYSTGDKCFKVLLFCPKEVIKPCHLVGDGNDVVFPKKNTPDAEVRFMALVQAMHNLNRIAIVRKVRTKNAKMVIGSLTADLTRKCLLFNELCFADDVSIPYFAPLIKSDAEDDLSEKEKLIDELISSKSIQFVPLEGPVDPNVHKMRQSIAQKFVGPSMIINSEPKDGVDLHFEEIVSGVDDDLLKKLKGSFPIKEIVEKGSDRPSGQQIFRKRARLEIENGDGDSSADKKVKAEDPTEPDPALKTEVDAEAEFDPDNLEEKIGNGSDRILYAFDFDHTIVDDNSDTFVTSAIKTPVPTSIKKFYDGTNWTAYMNEIMKFMALEGATVETIENHMQDLKLLPGMGELLTRINEAGLTNDGVKLAIISDANDFFIQIVLGKLEPPVVPHILVTNLAELPKPTSDSEESKNGVVADTEIPYLKIVPYEDQSDCPICPRNLCKGSALKKYIESAGPFEKIYYCGDGGNDICPGQVLRENDMLFARKGYALEKAIKNGYYTRKPKIPINISAQVEIFENGFQILEKMFN